MLSILLISCADYDNHQLKVEKIRESVNAVKFSVTLTGNDLLQCDGIIKYKDHLLHNFKIESNQKENPSEFLVNYSEFPDLALRLANDFVLHQNPEIEVVISNTRERFIRKENIKLDPVIPPIVTGIEVLSRDICRKYSPGYKNEVSEIADYLEQNNIVLNNFTIEKIATVSLLIKNNSKILPAVIPFDQEVPVYRAKTSIRVSVLMDSISGNPFITLFPAKSNKYYDGMGLYEIAKSHYTGGENFYSRVNLDGNKFALEKTFNVKELIGEYDLFLIVSGGIENYFYYDLGTAVFDNIAPEFDEIILENYYFGGNGLYEGKVYLDYSIPFKQNPFEVIFSGKVFGDVKDLSIDGKKVDIKGKRDIIFSKKIYIPDGYKKINVKITDLVGNLKNYTLPLFVRQ